ncbi:cytochrome c oxidase, subunit VIa, partial [Cladochytrium replicatum]
SRMLARFQSVPRRFASTSAPVPQSPGFPPLNQMMTQAEYEAMQHAKSSLSFWNKFNIFVTVPALAILGFFVLPKEYAHIKHSQEHPPEFVAYPHMRKRKSKFPWGDGDKSLFHNPYLNRGPDDE